MKQIKVKGDFTPHLIKAAKELGLGIDWKHVHSAKEDKNFGMYDVDLPEGITENEVFNLGVITNANFYYSQITHMLTRKEL